MKGALGMRGTLGLMWRIDDLGHRALPERAHRLLLGWLCDRLDRRLCR